MASDDRSLSYQEQHLFDSPYVILCYIKFGYGKTCNFVHRDILFGSGRGLCGESPCIFLSDKGMGIQDTFQHLMNIFQVPEVRVTLWIECPCVRNYAVTVDIRL